MKIDGHTPAEWVESGKVLEFTNAEGKKIQFRAYQSIDDDTGELRPAWPPGAEQADNPTVVAPNE